ncbi:MAG: hypothetical protein WAT81_01370 [Candidatus Moraniibacteriota bacterium]
MYGLALIYGFLAAAAALFAQIVALFFFDFSLTPSPSLTLLLGAATLEEGARLIFLLQLAKRHPQATSFIHALFFAFGFIAAELSLLALSPTDLPEIRLIVRMTLVHFLGNLLIYSGLRFRESFGFAPLIGLLGAILTHTLYNASL